jgi:hypothetical protein
LHVPFAANVQAAFASVSEEIQRQASERYLHNFYKLQEKSQPPPAEHAPSQQDIDMAMYRASKQKYQTSSKGEWFSFYVDFSLICLIFINWVRIFTFLHLLYNILSDFASYFQIPVSSVPDRAVNMTVSTML